MGRHINLDIKFREDFRPFAPAVTAEAAGQYFECDFASPYMILTAPVRGEYREVLGAVVHEDGSARLQTVTREANPAFHELLSRFGELSGVPVLLNTSLNRRGMPIVESPLETVEFFLECDLDMLVIDNYVVEKT
jgi:carbamoyltransferase